MMRKFLILTLTATLALSAADNRDPKAIDVAKQMMDAMGGAAKWDNTKIVRFDFSVLDQGKPLFLRSHLWNRSTGAYRFDSKTKEGKSSVVLMNLQDQKGSAYLDGKKLEGADLAKALKDAYGAYINDYYWLAMPWKWMDSGVNLKYLGTKSQGGETFDLVRLTFGKVGLTPGDRYDAWVSQKSHLMTHWEYQLQSNNQGSWDWTYVTTASGVKLASTHKSADGTKEISMGDVKSFDSVDPAIFTDPAKPMAK